MSIRQILDSNGGINEADLGSIIDELLDRSNVANLGTLLGILRREAGVNFFVTTSVSVDEERSSNYTIYVMQESSLITCAYNAPMVKYFPNFLIANVKVDQPSLGMSRSYLVADPNH